MDEDKTIDISDNSTDSSTIENIDDSDIVTEDEENKNEENIDDISGNIINEDELDNLIGGLDIETSEDINVPDKLIDQVIGQDRARNIIKKAAKQHRHVMMIGSPGTGKSMLSKAMTELMPKENLKDVLIYDNEDDKNAPRVRTVPSGKGSAIIQAHQQEMDKKNKANNIIMFIFIIGVLIYALIQQQILFGIIAAGVIYIAFRYLKKGFEANVPNLLIDNSENEEAPFEDATGAHAGALLGDVRHDPFQSGGMETPTHNRVEPGAIQKADNGVLFIDEINTLDVRSQQKLMTAIQEGEFSITGQSERSSGAMVQTEPVPTNFIMVAAGNMDAIENMHPALRDRLRGYGYEVYMDDTIDDTPEARRKYARFVAQEVQRDGDIPHFEKDAIEEVVLEAKRKAGKKGKITLKLRNLGGIVRTAGDIAKEEGRKYVSRDDVLEAKEMSQSIETQYVDGMIETKKSYDQGSNDTEEVGRVNGLAVMGDDSGIVLPVMGKVTPSQNKNKGEIIATGKLQEIAREAVDNVSAIIKDIGKVDFTSKDIHVQFVQTHEGVDGDSASVTVAAAIISAMENIPIKQNIAMTGSLSVRGDVLPVGGVTHKIEAAAKYGLDTVIIPKANENDVMVEEEYRDKINIIPVSHITEVLNIALVDDEDGRKKDLLKRLSKLENAPKID
jgi:Lon-like ATP-dependent protease